MRWKSTRRQRVGSAANIGKNDGGAFFNIDCDRFEEEVANVMAPDSIFAISIISVDELTSFFNW